MIGILIMLAAGTLPHTFINGGQLYTLCTGDEAQQRNCASYLVGAMDSAVALGIPVCVPSGTLGIDLKSVAVKYLASQRMEWASGGADLAIAAFRKAYPCKKT